MLRSNYIRTINKFNVRSPFASREVSLPISSVLSEGSGCYSIMFYLLPSLKYTSMRGCRRLIKLV